MEIKATQKFILISPKKMRPVADLVRGLSPLKAVEVLPHVEKKGAEPLRKVLLTAIANAKVLGFLESSLTLKEIQINEGPRLKRGRPVARGRWHPYKRRMSHIRVVLEGKKTEKKKPKKTESKTEKPAGKAKKTEKVSQRKKKIWAKK